MKRTSLVLAALVILGGVLSYLSWTHQPMAAASGKTVLLDVSAEEADAVRFLVRAGSSQAASPDAGSADDGSTGAGPSEGADAGAAEPEGRDAGAGPSEGADSGARPAGPEPAEAREARAEPTGVTLLAREDDLGRWWEVTLPDGRVVTGGDPAERVLAKLLPVTALRVLDDVSPEDRAELGVDEGEAVLTVEVGGADHRFRIGGESYGSPRRYVRGDGEARVGLLDAEPFRALAAPERFLVERDPIGVRQVDLEAVTVRAGDLEVRFVRQGDEPRTAYWSMPDSPDRPSEVLANWLAQLYRLRVAEYVPEGEMPGGLDPVVEVALAGDGAPRTLTLLRGAAEGAAGEGGAEAEAAGAPQGGPVWYARSDHLRRLVRLGPGTGEVAADAEAVVSGG